MGGVQLVLVGDEFLASVGQLLDAGGAGGVGHGAGFEGAEVAVEGGGGVVKLGLGAGLNRPAIKGPCQQVWSRS